MRKVHLLPNLLTLGNSFCGLLAICKGIDALVHAETDPSRFYHNMHTACWLVFLAQIFDALDGKVARMVGGSSAFGAQLDSFSDMLTFGIAPAILSKVLVEHEWKALIPGVELNPRWTFVAAACFSVMAILRLARFNLENDPDPEAHKHFKGLPSPAAAGAVTSCLLLYLCLRFPALRKQDGISTTLGDLLAYAPGLSSDTALRWFLPAIALLLPCLGLLMVSRVRYVHMFSAITGRGQFVALVGVVCVVLCLWIAPEPALFLVFVGYVVVGLIGAMVRRRPAGEGPVRA